MIKELRVKFIALSMVSLLLVLVFIMAGVNGLNYWGTMDEADELLGFLAENGGAFPKAKDHREVLMPGVMSPELPYESRYFSVLLDGSGNVVFADTGKIAAVDTETAIEYAQNVWSEGRLKGFVCNYRFLSQVVDGGTRIVFLDCGRSLDNCRRFLLTSCGISLAGLVAVFCLILLFSERIIRPVSESYEKQKQFITDAGHEIKTPLTIIAADADVLEMDVGENEWLQDIQRQAKRLTELTNDLIYLSRMEEERNELSMLNFPVSDVVEEAAGSFQALAVTQNKRFKMEIQPMLSLRGDEKALRQLVSILLDNALKYSPEGGEISLRLEKQARAVCLEVENTSAEKIDREKLGMFFERFYRADSSRSSQTGGYGIGLSVARAIVTAHKGKISAASPDGQRLTITAAFPQ